VLYTTHEDQLDYRDCVVEMLIAEYSIFKKTRLQFHHEKVQDENPRNAEAAYLLARVHETRGELGAALAEYRRPDVGQASAYTTATAGSLEGGKEQEAYVALGAASSLPRPAMERAAQYYRHANWTRPWWTSRRPPRCFRHRPSR